MSLIDDIRKDRETGTPGPWRVGPVDDTRVESRDGSEVAQIDGDYNQPDLWPIMEANARSIALVPDMEAALLAAEALADAVDEWKAKGRTPAASEALNAALGDFRKATEGRQ